MPLARIRTDSRELALVLAEELYELGYTVETISPAEYREGPADLEIQLEACDPNQLISLVASVGEKYKRVFVAEGVIDRLPFHSPVVVAERAPIAQQPIAVVEVAAPIEVPPQAITAPPVEAVRPPTPAEQPPQMETVLAAADSEPYAQQSTGRTRRVAELVASFGTTIGHAGLFASDKIDDLRERLAALRLGVARRRQARTERLQLERQRAAKLAAAEELKRESEREARRATEAVQPKIASSTPKQNARPSAPPFATANVRTSRMRSRFAKANAAGRQLRNSPAFALKFGTAVGLVGMVLLIAYANRRAPTPVGLGELTRSTTVQQATPFGAAEVKATAAQTVVPGTAQHSGSNQTKVKTNSKPLVPTATKPRASESDDYDEPEVVVRHYSARESKPVINTAKDDGIKRFSDLD